MNDKTLIALALAKTLYSEKRNYLDTFTPFLLRSLNQNEYRTIKEIEKFLEKNYSLVIPLNTIQSILKRLERDGYINLKGRGTDNLAAIPKSKATEHLDHAEDEADRIARKQNKLIGRLKNHFLEELNKDLSEDEVEKNLKKYILDNISNLALQNGQKNQNKYDYGTQNAVEKSITKFLITVFDQEQELYESFNDLLRGAVLWQSIAKKDSIDNESVINPLTVYLDTNIILSLLGLHHESINRAAKQLNELLQSDNKIHVRVFDKTLEEVINLLAGYKYNKDFYGSQRVNHVYFFLKQKGFDNADIEIFIDKIEDKLEDLGIYKEELGIDDTSDLPSREKRLYEQLYTENKTYETEKVDEYQRSEEAIHRSTLHDVAVISKIRDNRNGWQSSFERCRAIFLTNSYRLYAFSDRNKLKKQAITEVITDITLTNILWLKNPGSDVGVTIDNLLYVHSSEFMVDNKIWRKFLRTLKQMHEEGEIDEGDYALLMSKNQLKDEYLLSKKQEDITPESVRELTNDIKEQSVKKDDALKTKDKRIEQLEEKSDKTSQKFEDEKAEKEEWREDFENLKDEYDLLSKRFRSAEIEKEYGKHLKRLAQKIRVKTYWGIFASVISLGVILLIVKFLQLLPNSKPSFEFLASISIDILLVVLPMSIYAIRNSEWSFKDAWAAFINEEKLKERHDSEIKRAAIQKYERTQEKESKFK